MLFPSPSWWFDPLIIEEITEARAAVKFGSAVSADIVSATVCDCAAEGEPLENCRPENLDWLYSAWPITCGKFVICCCGRSISELLVAAAVEGDEPLGSGGGA